ncbi:MAG TPA: hypothetical protein VGW40_15765 [Allosphingosinicella sp.]|nr:hypothetical protein [Allosphingosinicella sp.]
MTGPETISPPRYPGFAAIERLADATGIMQHSRHSVPDPDHGYCVDDNARALILMHRRTDLPDAVHDPWVAVFANFVGRAWNPERGRFRNFMSFEGAWLEEEGSDDSSGRALWSLGATAAEARGPALRAWGAQLFEEAAGPMLGVRSPRAMAFCMLGATAAGNGDIALEFAHRLARLVSTQARPGWTWFEPVLAYDNCRLPEALLRAGLMLQRNDLIDIGLETLAWIAAKQTAPAGHFRAVGSESFGRAYGEPARFDQQPLEAQATVEACAAAFAATGDAGWIARARTAFAWFHGANDGGVALCDPASGECYDGLTPTGANLNRGAESVLAYQLAAIAMARLDGADAAA